MGLLRRGGSDLDAVERRLVWIVGSPRTGTTWLLNMLAAHVPAVSIDEPQIGTHLVLFSPDLLGLPAEGVPAQNILYNDWRGSQDDYFFSDRYAPVWEPALRRLLLERFAAQAADAGAPADAPILIKEPNGSQAAALIGRLLPQSRLLVVWRDGRDVIDSQLDSSRKGGWMDVVGGGREMSADERLHYLIERAYRWRARTQVVLAAYEAHDPGRRLAVTYEQLLLTPAEHLTRLASWLGAPTRGSVAEIAERYGFAAIDPKDKGAGKFARAATPGLWQSSFTAAEQERLQEIMGPVLAQLGY